MVATDLPEMLSLLRTNVRANESMFEDSGGSCRVEALRWYALVVSLFAFMVPVVGVVAAVVTVVAVAGVQRLPQQMSEATPPL